jgi:hypothetical protein
MAQKRLLSHETDPKLKLYGITVNPNMTEIQGRHLNLPQLEFARNSNPGVISGGWQSRGAVFKKVFPISSDSRA